jgi:hypothetical protein
MDELYFRLVERLLENPRALSRNRNFHAFEDPEVRRASRLFGRLTALARLIGRARQEGGEVSLSSRGEGYWLALSLPQSRATHEAFLRPRELALLLRAPSLRDALPPALSAYAAP